MARASDRPSASGPHPRRRPRPRSAARLRGHVARRPGRRARPHQADDPLLVRVEGGLLDAVVERSALDLAGALEAALAGRRPRRRPGRDRDAHGVPLRRSPPGAARAAAGGEPARARGRRPLAGRPRTRPAGRAGDRVPRRGDGRRHAPPERPAAAAAVDVRHGRGRGHRGRGAAGGRPDAVTGRRSARLRRELFAYVRAALRP